MSKVFVLLMLLIPSLSDAKTIIAANGPMAINVGTEEIKLEFDGPVTFQTRSINEGIYWPPILDVVNTDNYVLIKAKKPFEFLRLNAQSKKTGQLYLLDLTYSDQVEDVVIKDKPPKPESDISVVAVDQCTNVGCLKDPRAMLIRYGLQKHYAPGRVQESVPGLMKTKSKEQVSLPKGFVGQTVGAYVLKGYKLVVLKVTNTRNHQKSIDPRQIYAMNISMASAYQWSLEARGKDGDSTLMFVVLEV